MHVSFLLLSSSLLALQPPFRSQKFRCDKFKLTEIMGGTSCPSYFMDPEFLPWNGRFLYFQILDPEKKIWIPEKNILEILEIFWKFWKYSGNSGNSGYNSGYNSGNSGNIWWFGSRIPSIKLFFFGFPESGSRKKNLEILEIIWISGNSGNYSGNSGNILEIMSGFFTLRIYHS